MVVEAERLDELGTFEGLEFALFDGFGESIGLTDRRDVHTLEQGRLKVGRRGDHDLGLNERCRARHTFHGAGLLRQRAVVAEVLCPIGGVDDDVCLGVQDLRPEIFLEAVHDPEDEDDLHHADADHERGESRKRRQKRVQGSEKGDAEADGEADRPESEGDDRRLTARGKE